MKILKYLFFLILVVVIGAAIYIAILNGSFHTEKSIKLKAPEDLVYNQVNNLKNWKKWTAPLPPEKQIKLSFTEKTQGQGAFLTWREKDQHTTGGLRIDNTMHYSLIEQSAYIKKRIGRTDYHIRWHFENEQDTTFVTVQFDEKRDFWAKAVGLIYDKKPGKGADSLITHSLNAIKKRVLKKMRVYSITVDGVMKAPAKDYIYVTRAAKNTPESMTKARRAGLKKLHAYIDDHAVKTNGAPFIVYNTIDRAHGNVIISTAIPVKKSDDLPESGDLFVGTLPEQQVVKSTLKGDYSNIPKVWEAVKTYMQNNGLKENEEAHPYEIFQRSKSDSKNPADWITELYVPVIHDKTTHKLPKDLGI